MGPGYTIRKVGSNCDALFVTSAKMEYYRLGLLSPGNPINSALCCRDWGADLPSPSPSFRWHGKSCPSTMLDTRDLNISGKI